MKNRLTSVKCGVYDAVWDSIYSSVRYSIWDSVQDAFWYGMGENIEFFIISAVHLDSLKND